MNTLFSIVIANARQGTLIALLGSLYFFAAHAAYEIVTVKPPFAWRSSEPGPGLLPAWKIEFQNLLNDHTSFEDHI